MAKSDKPCHQQAERLAISCDSGSTQVKSIKTEYYGKEKVKKVATQVT